MLSKAFSPPSKIHSINEVESITDKSQTGRIDKRAAVISTHQPAMTLMSIPKSIITMEYACRGGIIKYGDKVKRLLAENPEKYSFKKLIPANIGNPLFFGQSPITFVRQVAACLLYPPLCGLQINGLPNSSSTENTKKSNQNPVTENYTCAFPLDVQKRAQEYLSYFHCQGAYSETQGCLLYREKVAKYLSNRDGVRCNADQIYLTDGATQGIKCVLELLITDRLDGVLIPVPSYPLYAAQITRLGGSKINYDLNESNNWEFLSEELERAYNEVKKDSVRLRAVVLINPSNPTGSVLKKSTILDVIRFCERHKCVLIADEVYQTLTYNEDRPFYSCRQGLYESNAKIELFSFQSISKSIGECGYRGGIMQTENISEDVAGIITKLLSLSLCSNTIGQSLSALLCDPPDINSPSYPLYKSELESLHAEFKNRAALAYKYLNQIPNISCQKIHGAMYAFPKVDLPKSAIKHAESLNIEPDMLYCQELIDHLGLICVPGSGFGQKHGTYHFRISLLFDSVQLESILKDFQNFHINFMQRYSDQQ